MHHSDISNDVIWNIPVVSESFDLSQDESWHGMCKVMSQDTKREVNRVRDRNMIPTTDSSATLALVEDLGVAAATLSSLVKARAMPKARRSMANVVGRNPSSTRIATRVMTILTLLAKPLFLLHLLPPLHTLP